MKDETTKQCEMAWERGRQWGFVQGLAIGGLLAFPIALLALFGN